MSEENYSDIETSITVALEFGATWETIMRSVITGALRAAWMRNGADDVYEQACDVVAQTVGAPKGSVTVPIHDPDNREYREPVFTVTGDEQDYTASAAAEAWVATWL